MAVSTESVAASKTRAFVGRQPIFLSNLDVFAYELLFRDGDQNYAFVEDGEYATASVVINSLTDIGLDVLTGSSLAFVNLTRSLLLDADLSCLPPNKMVLEVLEGIEPDDDVLAAIGRLVRDGFTIALDDFIYRPELEPLIKLADIVKIEFPQIPRNELDRHITELRNLGVRKILAEKLETHEEFELCKSLGCDLFQGYFFCRPQVLNQKRPKSNVGSVIQLVTKLQDPTITTDSVAELIQTDAYLSYKVLRFVNSASCGVSTPVDSLAHATKLLGLGRVRSLASMLLLATIDDDKPEELFKTAMMRAKMCELRAEQAGDERPERYFTLGLLSVMDALMDLPMEVVVDLLPLSGEINEALLRREGQLGSVLSEVDSFATGKLPACDNGELGFAYVEALKWTTKLREQR